MPILGTKNMGSTLSILPTHDGTASAIATGIPAARALIAPALPVAEVNAAAAYARAEKAPATRRAYRSDFGLFRAWCHERNAEALPSAPQTVAAFLAFAAAHRIKPSTIGRRLAAIAYAHKLAGLPLPTEDERVRATLRGIRRSFGTAPNRKTPITADKTVAMAPIGRERLSDLRDRTLLLVGFAGAFRRSELVALNVEDIDLVAIPRGTVACPVAALKAWVTAAGITAGPIFRPIAKGGRMQDGRLTDRSVAKIIKGHATRAGLDSMQGAAF